MGIPVLQVSHLMQGFLRKHIIEPCCLLQDDEPHLNVLFQMSIRTGGCLQWTLFFEVLGLGFRGTLGPRPPNGVPQTVFGVWGFRPPAQVVARESEERRFEVLPREKQAGTTGIGRVIQALHGGYRGAI